ncbi:MAG: response regulator [Acidobacteria bacterium]|nr:response regulator [Acidobacteriota bacterium]MDA1235453.1 response regulator [Acidobacteriota bacterium]
MTLLREAAAFHKAGDKEKARALLVEAATANPQNELVWLWQASLARTAAEAMAAIGKVLDLNPNNEKALGWKIKLEARFPTQVIPRNNAESNGAVAVAEPVEEAAEQAVEEGTAAQQTEVEQVVEEQAEQVAEEVVEEEAAAEDLVAEEAATTEEAAELREEEAIVETSSITAEEESETDLEAQASQDSSDDDALAAIEAEVESSTETEETTSVADFWSQSEAEDETEAVSEDDNSTATARALEALDQHVADTNVDAVEDDDPIRRLLAERDGTVYESDSDSSDDSWESNYSTEDQEESSADASLLAMFTQESGADETTTVSYEEEAGAEAAETVVDEQPTRAANTHWECPICGQQSHRVEQNCPTCKSVVDLNRLSDMARNEDVDRVSLKRLISDWEEQVDVEPTAALCTKLALGYLNLRQSNSALPHLLQAARMDRGSESLASALEQVSRRPLILVVDDSRTVQRMVLSTLERELFRVQIAEDGLQALAKLNEETPSLILLDITMPRMDGYQVCKVITGNDAFKHIPVVMLSGKDGFFDKVRGRMVGAKDYITKPFEADALVKSVRKRIETPSK